MAIKIYNQNGNINIDGKHYNLAFLEKVRFVPDNKAIHIVSFSHTGVVVAPLGSNQMVIDTAVYHTTAQNKPQHLPDSVVGKPFHATLFYRGQNKNEVDFYLFGEPSLANVNGQAGLKIYSEKDGKLVYDSRLKYLNVIGVCQHGLKLDPNKKYGLLTASVPDVRFFSGEDSDYEDDIESIVMWSNVNHTLTMQVYDVMSGRLFDIPANYKPRSQPPLLIDLTDF